jgi:Rad3-related DNA helicase
VRQDANNGKPCVQLSLWCMNPGCAFREIGQKARSVIVTSGTLSPMISFASELGIPFPGTPLTTGHVVPQDQVCAVQTILVHLSL